MLETRLNANLNMNTYPHPRGVHSVGKLRQKRHNGPTHLTDEGVDTDRLQVDNITSITVGRGSVNSPRNPWSHVGHDSVQGAYVAIRDGGPQLRGDNQ